MMLEWYVYLANINSKRIVKYDIFTHYSFYKSLKTHIKEFTEKESFSEWLRRDTMYYFWAKCEYEIILTCNPEWNKFKKEVIDVYDQLQLNWNKFVDYIWENKNEIC